MLLLLVDTLFVAFPSVVETGDANLQIWVGPSAARWGYLLLGLAICGSYAGVALASDWQRGSVTRRSIATDAALGGAAGVVAVAALFAASLLAQRPADLEWPISADSREGC